MSSLPLYFEEATRGRRFAATVVNLIAVGMLGIFAHVLSGNPSPTASLRSSEPDVLAVLLVGFWIVSVFGKSPGALFLKLKHCSEKSVQLAWFARLCRSLPYLCLGTMPQLFGHLLPEHLWFWYPYFVIAGCIGALADGAAILFTRRSLVDRWCRIRVLQLALPPSMKTTALGHRFEDGI